ncbi:hypothetical protein JVU11DRAFT_5673 [Chiua virens]|nr:hypothetical protein JVU11DRAFT_5673 [Chiua virens]
MFAPLGERWTLAMVRWWGGWAENEHRDTLIRYLLDELHTYETDHSDALAPVQRKADESLMGEAVLVQPVSVEDVRAMMDSFDASVLDLRTRMVHVHSTVRELADVVTNNAPLPVGTTQNTVPHALASMSERSNLKSSGSLRLTIKLPARAAAPTGTNGSIRRADNHTNSNACPNLPDTSSITGSPLGPKRSRRRPVLGSTSLSEPRLSRSTTRAARNSLPTPGLVIPDIPAHSPNGGRRPKGESWRDIVKHWIKGDPVLGLHTPLKDWPPDWTRGCNRVFAPKYQQRAVIALEFIERFHSNDARFLAAYPEAEQGHSALLRAINTARRARGEREMRSWPGIQSSS